MIHRLLIVGASARAAAWSARRGGFDVIAADLFADTDLQQLAETIRIESRHYPSGFAQLLRGKTLVRADAWLYTGCLENHPRLIGEMSCALPLLGNGPSVLNKVRDPFWLTRMFSAEGIPFPRVARTRHLGMPDAGCWLMKPFRSGGGQHIRYIRAGDVSRDRSSGYYLQQWITGPPHAAIFVASDQACDLIGVTRSWCHRDFDARSTQHAFRYCGSIGPVDLTPALTRQWQCIGNAVARHGGVRGLFGVDAIVKTNNQPPVVWPIEVNPRYTASAEVLERSLQMSLLAGHARVWTRSGSYERPQHNSNRRKPLVVGKRILFAAEPRIYDESLHQSLLLWQDGQESRQIADQPPIGTRISDQTPICTLLAWGDDRRRVEMALDFEAPS